MKTDLLKTSKMTKKKFAKTQTDKDLLFVVHYTNSHLANWDMHLSDAVNIICKNLVEECPEDSALMSYCSYVINEMRQILRTIKTLDECMEYTINENAGVTAFTWNSEQYLKKYYNMYWDYYNGKVTIKLRDNEENV